MAGGRCGTIPASQNIVPGSRVLLQGLAARPELNGEVLVTIPAEDAEQTQHLADTGRVKVAHYPKPLSLRRDCLLQAPEPDFASGAPFSVLEVVRQDGALLELLRAAIDAGEDLGPLACVGRASDALELAERLWVLYGRGQEAAPAILLPDDFDAIVLDTPGHWLYWLGLEQVGHQLVLEACDGVWRVHQAVGRAPQVVPPAQTEPSEPSSGRPFAEFGGVLIEARVAAQVARGYTAKAWATWDPSVAEGSAAPSCDVEDLGTSGGPVDAARCLPKELLAARASWAGGRSLSRKEAAQLLARVRALRGRAEGLAALLREEVTPAGAAPAEAGEWARRRIEAAESQDGYFLLTRDSPPEADALAPQQPADLTPGGPGQAAAADELWVFSSPHVEPACDLQVPSLEEAFAFMRDFASVTGEFPDARCFLALLEYAAWETMEREDGSAVGWTMRQLDLRAATEHS